MNLEKVFNFIKEKRGYDYPFKYKLINGLPLSEDELNVGGYLDLQRTPFSKKYTREEIRKMIVDKGGYIGGGIIVNQ